MKKLFITLLACLSMGAMAQEGLILHYDFVGDEGTTVRDKSDSHHDGTLKGSASVADGTVYLGNEDGYIDLGEGIGKELQQLRQFTVAVRYKVDSEASLKGQGYFLWAFSTMELNTQTEGRYHAYKLNVQRAENSVGGWNKTAVATFNPSRAPLQMIELTPDGHVAWEVSSWKGDRNLGPATTFQLLDEPVVRKDCRFGRFK